MVPLVCKVTADCSVAEPEVRPFISRTFLACPKKFLDIAIQAAMAPPPSARKRKAVTHDSPEADEVLLSDGGDDYEAALLNGIQSASEDEVDDENDDASSGSFADDSEVEDEEGSEDDIFSDEVPSDAESDLAGLKQNQTSTSGGLEETERPTANYRIIEDANGNPRYIYNQIDPVYDSDDSDAPATQNTIGNIPLSFYDSYPHIGYDINGKKIARPAKGEALDALLDSIDLPKGWTGLTDPATGKPLELSQQEYVFPESIRLLLDHTLILETCNGIEALLLRLVSWLDGPPPSIKIGNTDSATVIQARGPEENSDERGARRRLRSIPEHRGIFHR